MREYGLRDGRVAAGRSARRVRARRARRGARRARVRRARSTTCRRRRAVRAPRHPVGRRVALDEGTGIVHIAPGAGTGGLRARPDPRPAGDRRRSTRSGRMLPGYGLLEGLSTDEVEDVVIEDAARARAARRGRPDHAPLPDLLALQDAAPLPRRRRLVHRRRRDLRARSCSTRTRRVEWTPSLLLEADGRLAAQHGRLEHLAQALLRPAAAVLPVRVRPAERRSARAPSSRSARRQASTSCRSSTGPWIDEVPITLRGVRRGGAAHPRGRRRLARRRHRPVLDARLGEPGVGRARLRDRGCAGAVRRGPARSRRTGRVVSRPTGSPRAGEQIRLWFYSHALHVRDARRAGRRTSGCSPTRRVRDETGREMHKSTGNAIEANEAIERMGADVMRWMYSEQVPSQNLNFGYGPAHEIKRRLLTLWNSVKFFVDYANVVARAAMARELGAARPVAALARRAARRRGDRMRYERFWTPDVDRARSSRSSTTSRTGTSAGRGAASGTAMPRLWRRCGRRCCGRSS